MSAWRLVDGKLSCRVDYEPEQIAKRPKFKDVPARARKVIGDVCRIAGIAPEDLLSESREQRRIIARYAVNHILYHQEHYHITQIARIMNRNHASIAYTLGHIRSHIPPKKNLAETLELVNRVAAHD